MEYLDIYDENKNYLGFDTRDNVHLNGLWHNTVHCWLYDNKGNIYFQIRSDLKTFYTTASGHVLKGESIKEAFAREIKEEIGLDIDYDKAELVNIVIWKMDKEKNGIITKDRAFANTYIYQINDIDYQKFIFDDELDGVIKVNAKKTLELFKKEKGKIKADIITKEKAKNIKTTKMVDFKDFLVMNHEKAIDKYGDVLNKVIAIYKESK